MKTILHLCADTGSDTYPYKKAGYHVIRVGSDIGVEHFTPPPYARVHGIIANPVCTEFSRARSGGKARNPAKGFDMVRACMRIIQSTKPRTDAEFRSLCSQKFAEAFFQSNP